MSVCKYFSTLLLASVCLVSHALGQCQSLPEPAFSSHTHISGTWGQIGSAYRFNSVLPGIDAIISITGKSNASLASMDLSGEGEADFWQPQVNIVNQYYYGAVAHMDFSLKFVSAGTTTPANVSQLSITAVDVDGDDYRIREGVGFEAVNTFEMNAPSELFSYAGEANMTMFTASTVANQEDINTTAEEHMVSILAGNTSEVFIRCEITADPASYYSTAYDRMFSFSFDPCLSETFITSVSFPVELNGFEGRYNDGAVSLTWETATELNNSHFDIQRSSDGNVFYSVGTVEGQGTTQEAQMYAFDDYSALTGTVYYRLKQIDLDGQFQYSDNIEIEVGQSQAILTAWPNPASESVQVSLRGNQVLEAVRVLNLMGQPIDVSIDMVGATEAQISFPAQMPAGMYILQGISGGEAIASGRFLKQ